MNERIAAILNEHGLTFISILSASKERNVILAKDKKETKIVVKVFTKVNRFLWKEIDFLKQVSNQQFHFVEFPRILAVGNDFFLMSFLDREHQTRDSISQKKWTTENYQSFVSGLVEFQNIQRSKKNFTEVEQLKGCVFPVMIILKGYLSFRKNISILDRLKIIQLSIIYLIGSLFWKKVNVHYDFQTYNYSFLNGSSKMSILDFETGPYKGDKWHDVAYYCSISPASLSSWTYQKKILRKFIGQSGIKINTWVRCQKLRCVFVAVQLIRYDFFRNDSQIKKIYSDNISKVLLDKNKFRIWIKEIMN